jgi:hypothetical protein
MLTLPDDRYRPAVVVKRSPTGLGLYAAEDIPKEQFIIEYTGEKITNEEADERANRYLFEINDQWTLDGSAREHTARYANHSCRPNAEAELDEEEERIYLRARRRIKAGEEITYDYGKDHFDEYIKPKGCRCAKCVS